MTYPSRIRELIEALRTLPGIGPRQASRIAYAILEKDTEFTSRLASTLVALKGETSLCASCFRSIEPHTSGRCDICRSGSRESAHIMVVEKDSDLEAFESTGVFSGVYHVLGGGISALDKTSSERLRLKELFERVKRLVSENSTKVEITVATSNTLEGNQTATYIERILEPTRASVTRLGRGLATGLEIEYADPLTLAEALKNRK